MIFYNNHCTCTIRISIQVKLPQTHLNGFMDTAEEYEIRPVTGSNIFLILKKRKESIVDKQCCSEEVINDLF